MRLYNDAVDHDANISAPPTVTDASASAFAGATSSDPATGSGSATGSANPETTDEAMSLLGGSRERRAERGAGTSMLIRRIAYAYG